MRAGGSAREYETIRLEQDGGVTTLTLDRPTRKNTLTEQMYGELHDCFSALRHDRTTRVLVITGAGDAFCAGADLSRPDAVPVAPITRMRDHADAPMALHRLPMPTIAAVNGDAAGGGCNLALGCDLVLAADTARFTEVFVRRALALDWGGSWILPRLIGLQKAKRRPRRCAWASSTRSSRERN
jgi:2-(1,2-epoxy-1,2-dihydrophenyl)acetyl-CoA isomerase